MYPGPLSGIRKFPPIGGDTIGTAMEFGPSGPNEHGRRKRIDKNDIGIERAQGRPNAWIEVDMTGIT